MGDDILFWLAAVGCIGFPLLVRWVAQITDFPTLVVAFLPPAMVAVMFYAASQFSDSWQEGVGMLVLAPVFLIICIIVSIGAAVDVHKSRSL